MSEKNECRQVWESEFYAGMSHPSEWSAETIKGTELCFELFARGWDAAMKRAALSAGEAQKGLSDADELVRSYVSGLLANDFEKAKDATRRMTDYVFTTPTPPRQMVADSAGGAACRSCGGNDGDVPCAYPGEHERQPHCLRIAPAPAASPAATPVGWDKIEADEPNQIAMDALSNTQPSMPNCNCLMPNGAHTRQCPVYKWRRAQSIAETKRIYGAMWQKRVEASTPANPSVESAALGVSDDVISDAVEAVRIVLVNGWGADYAAKVMKTILNVTATGHIPKPGEVGYLAQALREGQQPRACGKCGRQLMAYELSCLQCAPSNRLAAQPPAAAEAENPGMQAAFESVASKHGITIEPTSALAKKHMGSSAPIYKYQHSNDMFALCRDFYAAMSAGTAPKGEKA